MYWAEKKYLKIKVMFNTRMLIEKLEWTGSIKNKFMGNLQQNSIKLILFENNTPLNLDGKL